MQSPDLVKWRKIGKIANVAPARLGSPLDIPGRIQCNMDNIGFGRPIAHFFPQFKKSQRVAQQWKMFVFGPKRSIFQKI